MKHAQDELVRIDGTGAAHPPGEVATQRMRTREGAFRSSPSPRHLVFMRYVGADGRRDREDGAVVRIAGEITGPGAMADVIALLAQAGWRGELVVQDLGAPRSLFLLSTGRSSACSRTRATSCSATSPTASARSTRRSWATC